MEPSYRLLLFAIPRRRETSLCSLSLRFSRIFPMSYHLSFSYICWMHFSENFELIGIDAVICQPEMQNACSTKKGTMYTPSTNSNSNLSGWRHSRTSSSLCFCFPRRNLFNPDIGKQSSAPFLPISRYSKYWNCEKEVWITVKESHTPNDARVKNTTKRGFS